MATPEGRPSEKRDEAPPTAGYESRRGGSWYTAWWVWLVGALVVAAFLWWVIWPAVD